MAESEEELKNLLMKVKEENENVGLEPNIQKTKIMASEGRHWNHNHRKLVNLITLGPQPCLTQWN